MKLETVVLVLAVLMLTHVPFAMGERRILLENGFESGQVQPGWDNVDGLYIATLPDPQANDEFIKSGSGGFDPSSKWDTKVVEREIVGRESIEPRQGRFFLRSAIHHGKDYLALNNYSRDKPRSTMNLTNPDQSADFDEEAWLGFSVFVPSNFEHETATKGKRGGVTLLAVNAQPSATFFVLRLHVPSESEKAHWILELQHDDSSAIESESLVQEEIDLGSVVPDLGQWTDFVIRFRANPFSKATNPSHNGIAESVDKLYGGNKGILQVWKSSESTTSNATGAMDKLVDRVNEPVGMVPRKGEKLQVSLRLYKFGWKANPTAVEGPVWMGFDEIRYGITRLHGTGYSDVLPSGDDEQSRPVAPVMF